MTRQVDESRERRSTACREVDIYQGKEGLIATEIDEDWQETNRNHRVSTERLMCMHDGRSKLHPRQSRYADAGCCSSLSKCFGIITVL